jgi:hypothetical protein
MSPVVVFSTMVVSFAMLLTSHVAIVIGLARRSPRYRALVAVVVPPVGAFWAFRQKLYVRAIAWPVALALYVAARILG